MNIENITPTYLNLALDYCIETFGISQYLSTPPNIKYISHVRGDLKWCGEYKRTDNLIKLWKQSHTSAAGLLSTLIHEYKHYLQNLQRYKKMQGKYRYNQHPHEIAANELGEKHKYLAKRYIAARLKEKNS